MALIKTMLASPFHFRPLLYLSRRTMSTQSQRPHLSEALKVGDLTLRNRNVMASLTRNRSVPTNVPNEYNFEYYTQRAQGGCALIMSEGTLISQQGTEWPNAPGIWSEEQVAAWKKITDSVHSAGALMFCQVCLAALCVCVSFVLSSICE